MPSWLTRTTVPPLLTGNKKPVRSNLPAAEHQGGGGWGGGSYLAGDNGDKRSPLNESS